MTAIAPPPVDPPPYIAIVCNGEMEKTVAIRKRIENAATVIGVDGGLNHCRQMHITPPWVVGDFDSIDPSILKEIEKGVGFTQLARAKDETDLEVAVQKAKQLSKQAQILIFGGLGGRIDHTLGNIYLLLRNPGRVFLESQEQVVFAVDKSLGKVRISKANFQTLFLFPLYGSAKGISIESEKGEVTHYPQLSMDGPLALALPKDCFLNVGEGEVLVCLDKRELHTPPPASSSQRQTDFSLKRPLIQILEELRYHSLQEPMQGLASESETVFNIRPSSGKVTFACQAGQTISLIPFNGPASGITTTGLKWELGSTSLSQLDKDFVGISNVCMGETFSLQISQGQLLCIINHHLIDLEIVAAKIEKPREKPPQTIPAQDNAAAISQPPTPEITVNRYLEASLIGAGGGLLSLFVEHPLDTVKTRMQASLRAETARSTAKEIYHTAGVRGFYAGAIPNAIALTTKQMYRWPLVLALPPYFKREIPSALQARYPSVVEMATGFTIANLEVFFLNPLERLKVHLMTQQQKGKQITEFFQLHRRKLLSEMSRGVRALYFW